jgi:integrase
MARPPLPIGTFGRIKLAREGPHKWRATCQFRDLDGQVRKVSRWEETKTKAEHKLREAIRDRQRHGTDITSDTRVPEVYAQWLAEFQALTKQGHRSATSLDTYTNRWNKLLVARLKGLRICELTPGRVDRILRDLTATHSASTARTCRAILSGLCGLAVRHGALTHNPVREARPIERPKRKPSPRVLTVPEALHIFELLDTDEIAIRQDLPDITRYLAGTGNRTGETLAIRWETINLTDKIAYVQGNVVRIKGHGLTINPGKTTLATRPIPLTDWLVDLLTDRRTRMATLEGTTADKLTGWVFPNTHGGLREAANLRRAWRAFRDRHHLGNWFTPYTLRRTVATLLTDKLPAREVSDLLGHSKISQTTDTYVARQAPSRNPAHVLSALASTKNDSSPQPQPESPPRQAP